MDHHAIDRAMNDKRLAQRIQPTKEGSWIRLLEVAWIRLLDVALSQTWEGYDLVSLLTVAYEIGERDGESEADMYGKEARLRALCDENMTDAVGGGRTDAGTIWPSEILAILDEDP